MYENAKHQTAKKIREFCENTLMGACNYLRLTATGAKVCIRDTEDDTGPKIPHNCRLASNAGPPCRHSARPVTNRPGELQCKSCERIRKCDHSLIGTNSERLDYCLICGLILGTGKYEEKKP